MALAYFTQPQRADRASSCELLGPDPLSRVLARLVETLDQLAVSAVIVCGAALWLAQGRLWGTRLVVGAVLTLVGLGGRLAMLIAERKDLVLDLIIRGGGDIG